MNLPKKKNRMERCILGDHLSFGEEGENSQERLSQKK